MKNTSYSGPLFGGAISCSQAEGGFREGGKGLSTQDLRYLDPSWTHEQVEDKHQNRPFTKEEFLAAVEDKGTEYYPNRRGIDFYHRYKKDIALFSELGLEIFRTSISWSRIYPEGDDAAPCRAGIEFYRDMFSELKKRGIKIFATILHYDIPVALVTKYGGWKSRKTVDLFVRYCQTLFENFGEYVDYWLPFNEINAAKFAPWDGACLIREDEPDFENAVYACLHNQFIASARAVKLCHEMLPDAKIGAMIARFASYPATCKPDDVLQALQDEQYSNWFYLDVLARGKYPEYMERLFEKEGVQIPFAEGDEELLAEGKADFIAFSYYFSQVSTTSQGWEKTSGNLIMANRNPYLETSEWGWQKDPTGLRITLNQLYDRYGLPMIIAENGLGTSDVLENDGSVHDGYRIDYLSSHIRETMKAVKDGVPVLAYMIWGIIDVVACGPLTMDKRYGVIYVDLDNGGKGSGERYRKDSFYWYQKCIAAHGELAD